MGRRSRKRSSGAAPPQPAPAQPPPPPPARPLRRRARLEDAPKAPWHPFPLVELAILAGLVMIGVGFASDPGDPRTTLLFGGIALVSIASLELAIREHFAGYRSHTTLLSAAAALAVGIPLWFTPLPQEALLVVAVAVGVAAFRALRVVFERRTGGMTWRA
jgi:hypothetical protein